MRKAWGEAAGEAPAAPGLRAGQALLPAGRAVCLPARRRPRQGAAVRGRSQAGRAATARTGSPRPTPRSAPGKDPAPPAAETPHLATTAAALRAVPRCPEHPRPRGGEAPPRGCP